MVGLVEAKQDLGTGRDVAQLRHASIWRTNTARAVLAPLQAEQCISASGLPLCDAAVSAGQTPDSKSGGLKTCGAVLHPKGQQQRTTIDTNSMPWDSPAAMASAPGSMPHEYHQSAPLRTGRSWLGFQVPIPRLAIGFSGTICAGAGAAAEGGGGGGAAPDAGIPTLKLQLLRVTCCSAPWSMAARRLPSCVPFTLPQKAVSWAAAVAAKRLTAANSTAGSL